MEFAQTQNIFFKSLLKLKQTNSQRKKVFECLLLVCFVLETKIEKKYNGVCTNTKYLFQITLETKTN
jgi:hypothetical protein